MLVEWSWANQDISLVDLIHLGTYELIELDIYAYVAWHEMIEWIKCLVIKFGLICVGQVHEMTFSKWIEWIYVLWENSNKLISSLIRIWWSIAQVIEICPILQNLSELSSSLSLSDQIYLDSLEIWYACSRLMVLHAV